MLLPYAPSYILSCQLRWLKTNVKFLLYTGLYVLVFVAAFHQQFSDFAIAAVSVKSCIQTDLSLDIMAARVSARVISGGKDGEQVRLTENRFQLVCPGLIRLYLVCLLWRGTGEFLDPFPLIPNSSSVTAIILCPGIFPPSLYVPIYPSFSFTSFPLA